MKSCNYRVVCLWAGMFLKKNINHKRNTPRAKCLSFDSRGFRDFGDTCTDGYPTLRRPLYNMRSERKKRWRRREQERHEGQHLAYWSELHYSQSCRTQKVSLAGFDLLCILLASFITFLLQKAGKEENKFTNESWQRIRTSCLVLLRHHDTAGQWLTVPQALLSEDARQSGQPPATETTHTPRQRVQEPHATGRHQCVWDWERR